jgi:hypothetical protein
VSLFGVEILLAVGVLVLGWRERQKWEGLFMVFWETEL